MKRILLFSPPFYGHVGILKEFISQYQNRYSLGLIVTSWKNLTPDVGGINIPTTILAESNLYNPDPGLFILPLATEHLEECLRLTKEFQPDLIIYDFQALVGKFSADLLNIPSICSIPSFLSKFDNQKHLTKLLTDSGNKQAIEKLSVKYQLHIDKEQFETIDNCLYLPGKITIVWSYKSLQDPEFMYGRHKSKYLFVGNIKTNNVNEFDWQHTKIHIYISLGTAIMGIIWENDKKLQGWIKQLILALTKCWNEDLYSIVLVNQGRNILNTYPKNWKVYSSVNQIQQLAHSDMFITHGGNNSYNEAVNQNTPMVVVPFFGDQIFVGKRVDELGLGFNIVNNDIFSNGDWSKKYALRVAKKINLAVEKLLLHKDLVDIKFKELSRKTTSLKNVLEVVIGDY